MVAPIQLSFESRPLRTLGHGDQTCFNLSGDFGGFAGFGFGDVGSTEGIKGFDIKQTHHATSIQVVECWGGMPDGASHGSNPATPTAYKHTLLVGTLT